MTCQPDIVDIRGLVEGRADSLARVAEALREPCTEWGLFHIVGHGIPPERLRAFEDAMKALFELSEPAKRSVRRTRNNARGYYDEELTKNRPDWKEVFDYGAGRAPDEEPPHHSDGVNQWPAGSELLAPVLLAHHADCVRVARALLRALSVSLGLAAERLGDVFDRDSSFVRLNRYVPSPDPAPSDAPLFPERGHLGVHHHTDAGVLTLLYQDEVAGLQAMKDGRFVTIEPLAASLTVNLADMLQVWSNDRYRSPLHRVLASAERTRHSAPFFLNPGYAVSCEPLQELLAPDEPARYRPISWAHFRDQRSAGDYANQGREIQIEDFRI